MPNEMSAAEALNTINILRVVLSDNLTERGKQTFKYIGDLLCKLAAGELREVVHGHWNYTSRPNDDCMGDYHDVVACAVCGEDYDFEYDYCPSCGALMNRGEKHEVD